MCKMSSKGWFGLLVLMVVGILALGATEQVYYTTIMVYPAPPLAQGNPFASGFLTPATWLAFDPLFIWVPGAGDTIPSGVLAGRDRVIPRLAVSYEDTPQMFSVKLREGVKWFDGTPFTAKDVWTTYQLGYLAGWLIWRYLDRIETPDDYTVQFIWKKPTIFAKQLLSGTPICYPYHIYGKWADRVDRTVARTEEPNATIINELREFKPDPTEIIGTGPFIIKAVTASEILAEKNPNYYYADRIPVDGVRAIRAVSNEVHWGQMIAGEIDFSTVFIVKEVLEAVQYAQPAKVAFSIIPGEFIINFDLRKYPYSELFFRKALIYAIDRKQVHEVAFYFGFPVDKYAHGVVKAFEAEWLSPEFLATLESYEYNPKKAEEILLGAGWSRGPDGNWCDAEGKPVKLNLTCVAEYTDWMIAADNIARQLTKFGLPTEVWTITESLFWATFEFDMCIAFGTHWPPYYHPWGGYVRLYTLQTPALGSPVGLAEVYPNLVAAASPLIEQLGASFKFEEQRSIVEKLAKLTNENVLVIPFAQRTVNYVYFEGLRVKGWPEPDDPIWRLPYGVANIFPLVEGILSRAK